MFNGIQIIIRDHCMDVTLDGKVVRIVGEPTITGFVALASSIEKWRKPKGQIISTEEQEEIKKAITKKTLGTRWEVWWV